MNTIEIGKYIKMKRIDKHLTQKELAEKLQISFQAVSKWETGATLPDTGLLLSLSDIIEVTVDQILSAGEFRMKMNKKINVEEIKKSFEALLNLKNTLGPNNGFYKNIINSVKDQNDNNLEYILMNDESMEVIVAKSVIQLIVDGYTLDEKDLVEHFKSESVREKLFKYQKKYNS